MPDNRNPISDILTKFLLYHQRPLLGKDPFELEEIVEAFDNMDWQYTYANFLPGLQTTSSLVE
jgi:hypothetical protein